MKTILFSLLFISLTVKLLPGNAASSTPDPVLDIKGDLIRTGTDYHILPVIRGRGGGVTLADVRNETCPLYVVQEQQEVSNGLSLTFTPVNSEKGVVCESTDLNIMFSAATICVQSTVWKLEGYDEATRQWFVGSGGIQGNPGRETTSNWFKIEKYEDDYKLVFCPSVCDYCKVICRDVGIYIEDEIRRLALSDEPFKVMFKRA
ncbi:Proteinase inhibitor I3, Kunitz legume [Dillenia turbinata]|uniref:Proteinase inhibitor I3, Kunitz legume n=1 Tax=Dillenia turbinata TaxID=194707 RepID=A0AAN8V9S1_9MAGN